MIKESKYYSDVMEKHLNKELGMTKEDNEDFDNSNVEFVIIILLIMIIIMRSLSYHWKI